MKRHFFSSSALCALSLGLAAFAGGPKPLRLKMSRLGYLAAPGFNVMLYNDNYSPVFFDQKDAAMQIIQYDRRIATNGSVRLMPTPEQWDVIPHLRRRIVDRKHNRLTAVMAYPAYHLNYRVVVSADCHWLMQRLPNARYVGLNDAEHEILMERDSIRAQFWAAFDGFVAEQLSGRQ